MFTTPILFLIFNRPDTTSKVFDQIKNLRPSKLYVSADGPRLNSDNEKELCETTRKIIEKVDWNCEVKTRFSDINLGCKVGVSTGINWFFEQEEEGIILEDDCLPDQSFFNFCEDMLRFYRNNEKVMHISGVNFQDGIIRGNASYYFSAITHIWGWATWRRAWKKYDVSISTFLDMFKNNKFDEIYKDKKTKKFWMKNYNLVHSNRKDTWDVQWMYAVSTQNGFTIVPNYNLVSNKGFESRATHTNNHSDPAANRPTTFLNKITHPTTITVDLEADNYTYNKYLNPNKFIKLWRLIRRYLT